MTTSGTASHGPVCSNRAGLTVSDYGLEKDLPAKVGRAGSRLPPALGEGAELEHGSEGRLQLSDDGNRCISSTPLGA